MALSAVSATAEVPANSVPAARRAEDSSSAPADSRTAAVVVASRAAAAVVASKPGAAVVASVGAVVAASVGAVVAAGDGAREDQMPSCDMRAVLISAALGLALPFVTPIASGAGIISSASAQTAAAPASRDPNSAQTSAAAQTPNTTLGESFADPEQAAAALVAALRANKLDAVMKVLGPGTEKLLSSGDPYSDAGERKRFLDSFEKKHQIAESKPGRATVLVGDGDWPLPIPIVKGADGSWHFNAEAGAQELVDRRIGRNELAAIQACLAYVDAQKAFHAMAEKAGQPEYAQLLASNPGRHDGLYWPSREGEPASPLAPLVAQAVDEGYPGERTAGKRLPYHGYFFRILTEQGADTPDGARSYIANGHMTGGFAMVAWPALYGASGIMSFIVDQDGTVFQKDLGAKTAVLGVTMKTYDPDLSWTRVDVEDDK